MGWPDSQLKELSAVDQPCDAEPITTLPELADSQPPFEIFGFRWPVYATAITSQFGIRQDPLVAKVARFHRGLDLSAAMGSLVYAAAGGVVVSEGWHGGHGFQVVLDHGYGLRTAYSHLSLPLVARGQRISEAAPIGVVGDTGRATGPHLHFEVSLDNQPMDPYPLLGGRLPTQEELSAPAPPRFIYANR